MVKVAKTMMVRLNETGISVEVGTGHASLHTYAGSLSVYDHVYLEIPRRLFSDDEVTPLPGVANVQQSDDFVARYVFSDQGSFDGMRKFMIANGFPVYPGLHEVPVIVQEVCVADGMRDVNVGLNLSDPTQAS